MKMLLGVLVFLSSNAFAATVDSVTVDQPVCFGREYSEKHMAKAPLQTVKKMSVKIRKFPEADGGSLVMDVSALIKKDITEKNEDGTTYTYSTYKPYVSALGCSKTSSTTLECYIDCDGGSAALTWDVKTAGQKVTLINNGFTLYGGCGEDEADMDNWLFLESVKGGDDVFELYSLPTQYCQN